MIKRLVLLMATVALLAAMVPGSVVAKDDGKSDCKKGGWQVLVRSDGSAFADQGSCVDHVANGGTPVVPTAWQLECIADGGTSGPNLGEYVAATCDWAGSAPYDDVGALEAAYQAPCLALFGYGYAVGHLESPAYVRPGCRRL